MRPLRRYVALFLALAIVSLMPRAGDGGNFMRPAQRGAKQVEDDEMAIFKPFLKAAEKAYEAAMKTGGVPADKRRGELVWAPLAAADTVMMGFKKTINDDYGSLFSKEKEHYEKDHKLWLGGIGFDLAGALFSDNELDSRYKDMASAGMVSFSSQVSFDVTFDEFNPGFNNNINYSAAYQDMMTKIQKYALSLLKDNESQTRNMGIADGLIKSPLSLIGVLDAASLSVKQYREALQIRNRANLFAAQEVSKLRLGIATQLDADAKLALARQQIRTDRQAAFKRSVGTWSSSALPVTSY
ncbi:hypothetical protein FACS1894204_04400 [Synergistales bacterium]|nr:hypothetical protein FACS1894204_04400 [Synergistales bacterium]